MNIIQPGDHVVLVVPVASKDPSIIKAIEDRVATIPSLLKDVPGPFNLTWLPIGSPDSDPYVLFVVRGNPNDQKSRPNGTMLPA